MGAVCESEALYVEVNQGVSVISILHICRLMFVTTICKSTYFVVNLIIILTHDCSPVD